MTEILIGAAMQLSKQGSADLHKRFLPELAALF
jgi:hypothetical protein